MPGQEDIKTSGVGSMCLLIYQDLSASRRVRQTSQFLPQPMRTVTSASNYSSPDPNNNRRKSQSVAMPLF